uniref:protein-arginine deiminase n=1 Tax=Cyanoderma ruficeps TaxID=181631 RepID=A0A8C3NXV7_9PASS
AGAVAFGVKHTEGVSVDVLFRGHAEPEAVSSAGTQWPLDEGTVLRFSMSRASSEVNDNKVRSGIPGVGPPQGENILPQCGIRGLQVTVSFYAEGGKPINQASWAWGPEGHGAILLVSCDKESQPQEGTWETLPSLLRLPPDLLDMAQMVLRTEGPQRLPRGYEIVLSISVNDADKVGVFHVQSKRYVQVLGRRKLFHTVPYPGGAAELDFFVEGLRFPDETFPGLVSIHVSLLEPLAEVGSSWELPGMGQTGGCTQQIGMVLEWTAIPLTRPKNDPRGGSLGRMEIQSLVAKAGCKLKVCFGYINRGDRWMQDEIEFGYTHAPHKSFPVVLDSPRERGMEQLPAKELLGPDFGYVHKEPLFEAVASLDSFGNVEVSPPVCVAGKEYPLGRILIGSSFPVSAGRRMTRLVRDFLYAQRVQAPVELYSDWLAVGNVNEFVTFVPTSDKKRFRMLLASPAACYRLFREKQKEGQGEATMFKGKGTALRGTAGVLSNEALAQQNQYAQRCIDWNRDILKKELGLLEEDIIDMPALFKLDKEGKAVPYFPNTVTMMVLARVLGIPKPFGPVAGGECCLERRIRALLEPLGLCCRFLEDVSSYHGSLGEVHCGTSVQRRPFAFKWWHFTP